MDFRIKPAERQQSASRAPASPLPHHRSHLPAVNLSPEKWDGTDVVINGFDSFEVFSSPPPAPRIGSHALKILKTSLHPLERMRREGRRRKSAIC